jgi:hypothetical protein
MLDHDGAGARSIMSVRETARTSGHRGMGELPADGLAAGINGWRTAGTN